MDLTCISCNRIFLSCGRICRTCVYDRTCCRFCKTWAMVVRKCLSRGSFYDRVMSRYSPHRPIPKFVRTFWFRLFMVMFIFTMFGVQMYFAWGDWNAMGMVFWKIILITTVVGIVLAFIYAPRTWCSFCPMGTLSSWVAPRDKSKLPDGYRSIHVSSRCQMKCMSCARVCPMQLTPYDSRGDEHGYLHPDCIKCGKCTVGCPIKIMAMH